MKSNVTSSIENRNVRYMRMQDLEVLSLVRPFLTSHDFNVALYEGKNMPLRTSPYISRRFTFKPETEY